MKVYGKFGSFCTEHMSIASSFLAYAYVDDIKLMHKFNLAMQSDAPWFISVFMPSVRVIR